MDANNWSPPQGGEDPMYTGDWRSQTPLASRQIMINKIMDTLKRVIPFSGHEGLLELKKIAVRLEEKIYVASINQSDYERQISQKMLTMSKAQNTMGSSIQFNSASDSNTLPDPVLRDASNNGRPPQGGGPSMDWRSQLQPDAPHGWQQVVPQPGNSQQSYIYHQQLQQQLIRHIQLQQQHQQILLERTRSQSSAQSLVLSASVMQPSVEQSLLSVQRSEQLPPDARHRIVNKITDVLKRNPSYGQVGLQELERIAATFEEKIYNVASSQSDYLRKISLKMLTMETQIAATPSNHSLDLESLFASLDLQD